MLCAFHLASKPRSANKQPKESYTQLIGNAARESYAGPLLREPLYSRIIWFHKYPSTEGDADNIAKRIHDALKGIIFADDRLITHTLAIRIDATESAQIIPNPEYPEPAFKLEEVLANPSLRDILYIELGLQSEASVQLGPVR